MPSDDTRSIVASVPFFTKQMTGKRHIPEDLMIRQFPAVTRPARVAPQMKLAV